MVPRRLGIGTLLSGTKNVERRALGIGRSSRRSAGNVRVLPISIVASVVGEERVRVREVLLRGLRERFDAAALAEVATEGLDRVAVVTGDGRIGAPRHPTAVNPAC